MRIMHELAPEDIGPPQLTCEIVGLSSATSSVCWKRRRLSWKNLRQKLHQVMTPRKGGYYVSDKFEPFASDRENRLAWFAQDVGSMRIELLQRL